MTQTTPPKYLILYADDDLDDISLVESAFTATTINVELITAYDGEDVLEYLENLTPLHPDPCLIILDINMPKLNGKDTLQRIRQMDRYKNIPVVLFTTSSMEGDSKFAERFNASLIIKPLNSYQMQGITNRFIEQCTEEVRRNIRKRLS